MQHENIKTQAQKQNTLKKFNFGCNFYNDSVHLNIEYRYIWNGINTNKEKYSLRRNSFLLNRFFAILYSHQCSYLDINSFPLFPNYVNTLVQNIEKLMINTQIPFSALSH